MTRKEYWDRVHKIYGAVNGHTESRARIRNLMFNATGFKVYNSGRRVKIAVVRKSIKAYKRRVTRLANNLRREPALRRKPMKELKASVIRVLEEDESYVPYPDGEI